MRLIAHLSDLHFGREDPRALAELAHDLAALRPDLIAVSGDLTQRARTAEFAAAHAFLASLRRPLVVVPGNHDLPLFAFWRRVSGPFAGFRRHFGDERLPAHVDDEIAVLGVVTPHAALWKRGRLAAPQLARLAARFAATPNDRLRVVVAHHPLVGGEDPRGERAHGASDALISLQASAVDVVLSGHQHRSWSGGSDLHRPAPGERAMVMVHAGTAVSDRLRHEGNAYNVLRCEGHRLAVCVRALRGDGFAEIGSSEFQRTPGGWVSL